MGLTFGCVRNRDSGGKELIFTSEAEENQLGTEAYEKILAEEPVAQDPWNNQLLSRVAHRVAQAANREGYEWQFRLLRSKEKNAFCLPGGKIAVYTGILSVAESEAGLATVLGHEIAHATSRHAGERLTQTMGLQLGFSALSGLLDGEGDPQLRRVLLAALGAGATLGVTLPFSRQQESEADAIGLKFMAKAGYDPREAPRFWSRFAAEGSGGIPTFLSTHPSNASRQKALETDLPKVLPLYEQSPKYGVGERFSTATSAR